MIDHERLHRDTGTHDRRLTEPSLEPYTYTYTYTYPALVQNEARKAGSRHQQTKRQAGASRQTRRRVPFDFKHARRVHRVYRI